MNSITATDDIMPHITEHMTGDYTPKLGAQSTWHLLMLCMVFKEDGYRVLKATGRNEGYVVVRAAVMRHRAKRFKFGGANQHGSAESGR